MGYRGPQTYDSGEGWSVEFLGHGKGSLYREGEHTLFFDAEFLADPSGQRLGVWRRPIVHWDPPRQIGAIHEAHARLIPTRLATGLRAMGFEPVWDGE